MRVIVRITNLATMPAVIDTPEKVGDGWRTKVAARLPEKKFPGPSSGWLLHVFDGAGIDESEEVELAGE